MSRINTTPVARITRSVALADFDISTSEHRVEGLAIPFDRPQRVSDDGVTWYDEEFDPDAFSRQLLQQANIGRVRFVVEHRDPELWIGKGIDLKRSREGLVAAFRVDQTPITEAWLWKISDGQLPGLSVEASIYRTEARRGVQRRMEAWLRHVAAVTDPAYIDARVTAVRSEKRPVSARREFWAQKLAAQR